MLRGHPCRPSLQPHWIWRHQLLPIKVRKNSRRCRLLRLLVEYVQPLAPSWHRHPEIIGSFSDIEWTAGNPRIKCNKRNALKNNTRMPIQNNVLLIEMQRENFANLFHQYLVHFLPKPKTVPIKLVSFFRLFSIRNMTSWVKCIISRRIILSGVPRWTPFLQCKIRGKNNALKILWWHSTIQLGSTHQKNVVVASRLKYTCMVFLNAEQRDVRNRLLYTVLKLFLHVNCNFSAFRIGYCFKLFLHVFILFSPRAANKRILSVTLSLWSKSIDDNAPGRLCRKAKVSSCG